MLCITVYVPVRMRRSGYNASWCVQLRSDLLSLPVLAGYSVEYFKDVNS